MEVTLFWSHVSRFIPILRFEPIHTDPSIHPEQKRRGRIISKLHLTSEALGKRETLEEETRNKKHLGDFESSSAEKVIVYHDLGIIRSEISHSIECKI